MTWIACAKKKPEHQRQRRLLRLAATAVELREETRLMRFVISSPASFRLSELLWFPPPQEPL